MNHLKRYLLMLLISSLLACAGPTRQEQEEERKDKEGAVINVKLAAGYIRRGDYEVAEGKLKKAIRLDKTYIPAYTTMAVLQTIIGKPTEAENYYLEALDLDPKNPELRNNYGTFLCKQGKYDEAFKEFNLALKNPFYDTPEAAHANMGYCMMLKPKPDYKQVERHLRAALAKQPKMVSALIGMGELGIKTRQYLMARAYMQRYHALEKPTAHSLWVQIQAEYALGDKKYFMKLSKQLLKKFPQSEEAAKVMELSDL